jgi:hypothetical protein
VSGQKTVQLIEPNTLYLPYVHLLNARLAKRVEIARYSVTLGVDLYNTLNNGATQGFVAAYGFTGTPAADRTWGRPTSIIAGRSYRINANVTF